jgi:hypothetical protein
MIVWSTFNNLVGRLIKVDQYRGYVESLPSDIGKWRTPECTLKDIYKYWKPDTNAYAKVKLPFD